MRRLLLVAIALVATACTARRLRPPPRPAALPAQTDLAPFKLYLTEFVVDGASTRDTPLRVEAFQDRFLDYLESRATFAEVVYDLEGEATIEPPALAARVQLSVSNDTHRTWLLDALNVWPFVGGLPLVPAWGEAEVAVTMSLGPPGGPPFATYRETVRAAYSALFFGWYRRRYLEDAFARAAGEAFGRIADALPQDVLAYRARLPADPTTRAVATLAATTAAESIGSTTLLPRLTLPPAAEPPPPADSLAAQPGPNLTYLEEPGVHIVTDASPPVIDGTLLGYLRILGGVEATGVIGIARVSSKARLQDGSRATVASGSAGQRGYRISLYSPPTTTGTFIYPVVGYLNQQIDNVDVHSALAELNALDASRGDIGAIATDPETGGGVDAGAANVYHLAMQSGYGGFRTGFDLVAAGGWLESFCSLTLGINLVEYRKVASILDECGTDQPRSACTTAHRGWDFLKSGAVGGVVGVRVPDWHTALRLNVDYERYREFEYDHPLDVRGPPTYDPATGLFSHEMVEMRGASLSSWVVQLALGVVF